LPAMPGISITMDQARAGTLFSHFLDSLPGGRESRIHIIADSDADGLPGAAILVRALNHDGYEYVTAEPRRKFESAWTPEVRERLTKRHLDALVVIDLGTRSTELLASVPTLLIDHHAPSGVPGYATLISSYGSEPTATSGLLAYWCSLALAPGLSDELLWLAAISLLSDLGDKAPFTELARAKSLFGAAALKELTALINAPRRSAAGDAAPALNLLLTAQSPKQILKTESPELAALRKAKEEVADAITTARRARPYFTKAHRDELGADLAAIRVDSPCQVHPLVAQMWRGRLPKSVVFGVNTGFRPGFVHFSGRAPGGIQLLRFLRHRTPAGADDSYGGGHDQAAGGALRIPIWNKFASDLGFGPELQVEVEGK